MWQPTVPPRLLHMQDLYPHFELICARVKSSMIDEFVGIRVAKVNDFSTCLPFLTSLYHGDIRQDFKQTFEDFVNNKNNIILLAENSNKVIGILIGSYHLDIDWQGKTGRIQALIVDNAFRRKGIGRRLVYYSIAEARKEHCKAIRSR